MFKMQWDMEHVQSVLCIGAHADDIEIGCGGTLLQLLIANPKLRVHWVVLSGNQVRRQEALNSFDSYCDSSDEHVFRGFDFHDSFFPAQWQEIKQQFHQLAADVSPQLIFTHYGQDAHQDHRVVAEFTANAFRDQVILEYEIPKYDADLAKPNIFVPLAETIVERKVDALLRYFPSQCHRPWFDQEAFMGLMRLRGLESKAPSRYAEAFHCRKLVLGFS
jgi:LmbE family N-acetylglucosaminyl deacetylase